MTPLTERNMLPQRGASFFRDPDGEVLFQFVVDTSNVIGPRPMTKADREKHANEYGAFWNSDEKSRQASLAGAHQHHANLRARGLRYGSSEEGGGLVPIETGQAAGDEPTPNPAQVSGQPEAPRRKTLRLKAI